MTFAGGGRKARAWMAPAGRDARVAASYGLRRPGLVPNYLGSRLRTAAMDPLKLVAFDQDDIAVISTHLQDALVNVDDIIWRPAEKRLVLGLNRFDWEGAVCGEPLFHRRRTVLRFERVDAIRARNVRPTDKGMVLNLLAVDFCETEAPGGCVTLTFSGGAALRLEVECLEVELADLGPAWTTTRRPEHPEESAESRG